MLYEQLSFSINSAIIPFLLKLQPIFTIQQLLDTTRALVFHYILINGISLPSTSKLQNLSLTSMVKKATGCCVISNRTNEIPQLLRAKGVLTWVCILLVHVVH